jgi:hypothetical protein
MPVKFGLWRVDGTQVQQVPPTVIASEERLEEIIEARIDILGLGTSSKSAVRSSRATGSGSTSWPSTGRATSTSLS